MTNLKSLLFSYLFDAQGGVTRANWSDIDRWQSEQGYLWMHLNLESKKSKGWLMKNSGLNKFIVQSLTANDTRPRVLFEKNGLLVFLRVLNTTPGEDPEDMVSIRIWVDENRIITIQRQQVLPILDVQHLFDAGKGPTNPIALLFVIIDKITDNMVTVIDKIDTENETLDHQTLTGNIAETRTALAELRRQMSTLRRYLSPQRDALTQLFSYQNPLLDDKTRYQAREIADRVIRHLEELDTARELAAITQEELNSRQNELINHRMYLLSAVNVVFLPLSFITGLLGVNVGGIPGADNPLGFLSVSGLLVLLVIFILVYFKIKKWI